MNAELEALKARIEAQKQRVAQAEAELRRVLASQSR